MAKGFPSVGGDVRTGMARGLGFTFFPTPGILARDLNNFGMDVRSYREPLKRAIKEVMIPSFKKNFDSGGRPAWEPLTAVTVELRGSSSPILVRSGRLRKTMGQQNIWTVTRDSAIIRGLPQHSWYGLIHQAGNNKNVTIPARPFALFQPEDHEKIAEVFDQWIGERAAAYNWVGGVAVSRR